LPDGSVFKEVEELHHWLIPQRAKWVPNWILNARWNLKRLWTLDHAAVDFFRYQFIPKAVKPFVNTKFKKP
jgi:hypothetical protein